MKKGLKASVHWAIKNWERIPPEVREKGAALAKELFYAAFKRDSKATSTKKKSR